MPEATLLHPQVFTVAGLLTPAECDEYVALSESIGYDAAPITTMHGPVMNPAVRNNERVMLDDVRRGQDLWRRVAPFRPAVEGTALLFHHPLVHQGAAVTRGREYVLRTDVMYADALSPGRGGRV